MLTVVFGWFWEDFLIDVQANPRGRFITSSAMLGGPHADFDEADITPIAKMPGNPSVAPQVPAVHEFGHLLGLEYPGQSVTPPAPLNSPADYLADAPALMGGGMAMRPGYFQFWADYLDAFYGTIPFKLSLGVLAPLLKEKERFVIIFVGLQV